MPETDICQYYPRWFREILDFQSLCYTERQELNVLAEAMDRIRRNLFVQTMDEGTAAQWETILRILPTPGETLEFRRLRVLNRLALRPPFTLNFLRQKLDVIFGPGNWEVEVDYPNYTLYIEASAEAQPYFLEVSALLSIIKPCHIVYISRPRLDAALCLAERVDRMELTYNYIQGAWSLGEKPFLSILEREVLKLEAMPSIRQALLEQTAAFVAEDVASARINGRIVITALTCMSNGNTGSILYQVRREQTEAVEQVELLDKSGGVLCASKVYLPLTEDVMALRHNFIVKEGS